MAWVAGPVLKKPKHEMKETSAARGVMLGEVLSPSFHRNPSRCCLWSRAPLNLSRVKRLSSSSLSTGLGFTNGCRVDVEGKV